MNIYINLLSVYNSSVSHTRRMIMRTYEIGSFSYRFQPSRRLLVRLANVSYRPRGVSRRCVSVPKTTTAPPARTRNAVSPVSGRGPWPPPRTVAVRIWPLRGCRTRTAPAGSRTPCSGHRRSAMGPRRDRRPPESRRTGLEPG